MQQDQPLREFLSTTFKFSANVEDREKKLPCQNLNKNKLKSLNSTKAIKDLNMIIFHSCSSHLVKTSNSV